jgi:hypothetical protein
MGSVRGPLSRLLRTGYAASSAYGRLSAVGAAAGGGGYAWPANGGANRNFAWTSYSGNGFDWPTGLAAYDIPAGKWSGNIGYTPPAATVYGAENHDSYLTVPVEQADRQQRLELLQGIASTLVNTLGIGPVNSSFYEDLLSTPSAQQSTQVIAYLLRPVLHVEGSRSRPGIIVVRHCRLYCPFFISLWLSTCK